MPPHPQGQNFCPWTVAGQLVQVLRHCLRLHKVRRGARSIHYAINCACGVTREGAGRLRTFFRSTVKAADGRVRGAGPDSAKAQSSGLEASRPSSPACQGRNIFRTSAAADASRFTLGGWPVPRTSCIVSAGQPPYLRVSYPEAEANILPSADAAEQDQHHSLRGNDSRARTIGVFAGASPPRPGSRDSSGLLRRFGAEGERPREGPSWSKELPRPAHMLSTISPE